MSNSSSANIMGFTSLNEVSGRDEAFSGIGINTVVVVAIERAKQLNVCNNTIASCVKLRRAGF